ncbi:MAG: hypothetical protein P8N02_08430 [Actinomycetota bacterium]|nr:hypothetical protein [Actinomycetota bacterium]
MTRIELSAHLCEEHEMSEDKTRDEVPPKMFPGGWDLKRKPTIEMSIKGLLQRVLRRG